MRHLAVWSTPDMSQARCTSSRVTWGGGECLDDAGELARSCPRHAPVLYAALDARHAQRDLVERIAQRHFLNRWKRGLRLT